MDPCTGVFPSHYCHLSSSIPQQYQYAQVLLFLTFSFQSREIFWRWEKVPPSLSCCAHCCCYMYYPHQQTRNLHQWREQIHATHSSHHYNTTIISLYTATLGELKVSPFSPFWLLLYTAKTTLKQGLVHGTCTCILTVPNLQLGC